MTVKVETCRLRNWNYVWLCR